MFIVLPACSNSNVLSTLSYFKTIISLILYVVPSILIVVSGFKLFKIVTSSDPDLKKGMGEIIGKMIGFAAIFFIPMLVTLLGIVIEAKPLQSRKAPVPMLVTLLGMVILSNKFIPSHM